MKLGKTFWAGLVLVLVAGAAIVFFPEKPKRPEPLKFTVYFTCDTRGRLVPCGCFTGQYGGLSRLKTYLHEQASDSDIKVDVGDAIAGREDFHRVQYRYVLQAYSGMGYDAVNLGHREARLSLPELQTIKQQSPVTLLSANLREKNTGKRIFEPCKIIERGRFKIALVGVMDDHLMEGVGDGLTIAPMDAELEQLLPALRKQVDALILLAFTDENGLARLAQQFYEANLILGGKVSQPSQKLLQANRSTILYTANESRTVGFLRTRMNPNFEPVSFDLLMLHDKIPEHPEIISLANKYRDEVRSMRLDIDDLKRLESDLVPGVKTRAAFAGTEACVSCHKQAAQVWQHSKHSLAFTSLLEVRADADPNCISCHVVGFGTVSGYRREFKTTRLTDVGCESCHGPGSIHVQERQNGASAQFQFRPLAAGDCKKCHYGEFSRPFDWDEFWPLIKHGKEPHTASVP